MRKLLPALGILALVAGCAAPNAVTINGHVDPGAKTALVPEGGDGIIGPLKWALVSNGWKISIADGEQKVAAAQPVSADAKAAAAGQARYTFAVDQTSTPVCAPGQTAQMSYEITVTDNKTGNAIASFKGEGSLSGMRDKMTALMAQL